MKKRMILITITLIVIAIAFSVYVVYRPSSLVSVQEQIPEPKLHEHVAPDGSTVQHIHTYDFTQPAPNADKVKQEQQEDTKHPIQRAWELFDLADIKKKYQPYTVAEMNEMWYSDYLVYGLSTAAREALAEEYYPRDQWLEDLMALGHPFMEEMYYSLALGRRIGLMNHARDTWNNGIPEYDPETGRLKHPGKSKENLLRTLELPSDTTWEEYVEMKNKFSVVRLMNVLRAQEIDPDVDGGVTSLDGSFLPFSPNLVNVHIDPETGRTKFIGPGLTAAEEHALVNYGVAPEGMSVVYIDANDKPIPSGKVPPRFFERNMKELEAAQILLQQQIEEHEFLLEMDTLLTPSEDKKPIVISPHDHGHEKDPDHTHEAPQTDERSPSKQQRQSPNVRQLPPGLEVPPDLHTQDDINRWFTALEALHGGQLPKDLHALQEVITELEKVRQDAEKNLKPPERQEPPAPPVPPEGSSPTPDEAD